MKLYAKHTTTQYTHTDRTTLRVHTPAVLNVDVLML